MAVKIRLKQIGRRNRRQFRIVAVDESKKRDGAVIEELGMTSDRIKATNLKKNRIDYWLKLGAKATGSVSKILQTA